MNLERFRRRLCSSLQERLENKGMFRDRAGFDSPFEKARQHVAGLEARVAALDQVDQMAVADMLDAVDMQILVDLFHQRRIDPRQLSSSYFDTFEHWVECRAIQSARRLS